MSMRLLHKPQRVFIGIKMSEEIADACVKLQADLADLPARFIPPEDIHLTLVPPWDESDIRFAEYTLQTTLFPAKCFTLELQRLSYGPDPMRPWLAWIECAASAELVALKKELMKAFGARDSVPFTPHVTIARFSEKDAEVLTHRPIDRSVRLSMRVDSVQFFSSPGKGGEGYTVLASLPLCEGGTPS